MFDVISHLSAGHVGIQNKKSQHLLCPHSMSKLQSVRNTKIVVTYQKLSKLHTVIIALLITGWRKVAIYLGMSVKCQ